MGWPLEHAFQRVLEVGEGLDVVELCGADEGTDRCPACGAAIGSGKHWAIIASLIETCKLNAVDPQRYLTDVIARIVNGHPNSRIDELLPWIYLAAAPLKDVA